MAHTKKEKTNTTKCQISYNDICNNNFCTFPTEHFIENVTNVFGAL